MILSFWGWVIAIITVILYFGYANYKNWAKWKTWAGWIIIFLLITMIFPSNSFTGDIEKDARIMIERIYDGESTEDVSNDLAEYYVDKGYGMNRAKEVLNRATELVNER